MSIVAILLGNVADTQQIQLFLLAMARDVDREQDGPRDATANKTHGGRHLEVAQEEITIEGFMVQDVSIGDLDEISDPSEQAWC